MITYAFLFMRERGWLYTSLGEHFRFTSNCVFKTELPLKQCPLSSPKFTGFNRFIILIINLIFALLFKTDCCFLVWYNHTRWGNFIQNRSLWPRNTFYFFPRSYKSTNAWPGTTRTTPVDNRLNALLGGGSRRYTEEIVQSTNSIGWVYV